MKSGRIIPNFVKLRSGLSKLLWPKPPRNIFIAKKDFDDNVLNCAKEFMKYLDSEYPVTLLTESKTKSELGLPFVKSIENARDFENNVDLVVTMGGDGTMLHAMSMFKHLSLNMPPVLSFSMGTLGFLLPFDYRDSRSAFHKVYSNQSFAAKRSRLRVTMPDESVLYALNELTIHRGNSPHLAELDISINGQYLTTAIADGISISTPTGSTAYSLSAGGSIVHPGVESILLTPICPRSLSFRPLLFPQDAHVTVSMARMARGSSQLSLDGDNNGLLPQNHEVSMEVHPEESVWCISQGSETDDWVRHVNGLLGFNSKFGKGDYTNKL